MLGQDAEVAVKSAADVKDNAKMEHHNLKQRVKADDVTQTRSHSHTSQDNMATTRISFTKTDIDTKYVDKDSDLEGLLETMSCNGHKATGIHPELKNSTLAIKLEEEHEENLLQNNTSSKRNFLPPTDNNGNRWENGIVPYYVYIDSYADKYRNKLLESLAEAEEDFRKKTCIKLIKMTDKDVKMETYKNFINISSTDSGCWSKVGKISLDKPGQPLNLDTDGCIGTRTVIHELGHSLGMKHEQSRTDRDKHIDIDLTNTKEENEYRKVTTLDTNPYDYNSVMQYDLMGFAIKSWVQTIYFKDPDLEFLAEHAQRLTYYDAMDINKVYNCSEGCEFKGPCLHGGYVGPWCECICPEGVIGRHCERISSADVGCGEIIDLIPGKDITITSPNYPNNYIEGQICYWLLRAEHSKQRVMIEVDDFDVAHNEELCRCYHWLEVRYNLLAQPGPKYCGSRFDRNKISTTEFGNSHMMMLIFNSATVTEANATKGFSLKARAIELQGEGCTMEPPIVANSSDDFEKVGSVFGTVVRYTCNYEYQMLGKNGVTCEADGTWSEERFKCVKNDPLFHCDLNDGVCGITVDKETHNWTIITEEEQENPFFTVTPKQSEKRAEAQFTIPLQLKADVTYCLSFFFQRYNDEEPCATLYVGDDSQRYYPWTYKECKKTEWTEFTGNYGPYNKDMRMQFMAYLKEGGSLNIDIDDIRLQEGSC